MLMAFINKSIQKAVKYMENLPKLIISLDTRKSYVMEKGIKNGVSFINDVSGLNFDKKTFDILKSKKIPFYSQ